MNKENYRILIVDDEESFLLLLQKIVQEEGYSVRTASNGEEALKVSETFMPHLVITDLKMPVMDGLALLQAYKKKDKETDFIVLTAYGTIQTAIQSLKMGALDYILKPLREPLELRQAISRAYGQKRLMDENLMLKTELDKDMPPLEILFAGMEDLLEEVKAVAQTGSTILLLGETGTGKSVIARVIHKLSGRKGLFVEINCASVPENLLESEFFGHEKGAFTGAVSSKKGKFEITVGGTILLDEISEMDGRLQAKLLRVLQDGTFERVGSNITGKTDARVICATNRDLQKEVSEQRFREDLFFRLNVFPLTLSPLRERTSHIPVIAEYLVRNLARKLGKENIHISEKSMEQCVTYGWPGNIRELQNILERAIILSQEPELDLSRALSQYPPSRTVSNRTLKDIERRAIEDVLRRTNGNRKNAAGILGISVRNLQYKIKEFNIDK